ncbi:MAG: DNA repair protein RecN [Acidimicrobiales bacterium]
MLAEIHVRDLGVIADLTIVFGPGMTALTGETGAGKTLVVEAIELLVGGRADPVLVRPGSPEALVEGRFVDDEGECVLARAVPRAGRSRAYIDGRLATVAELGDRGRRLVDLHGQHGHHSLLSASVQRQALDRFGAVDLGPLIEARARLVAVSAALDAAGGDSRARAREIDLLGFQVDELAAAALVDADEDEALAVEEDLLGQAEAYREAGAVAHRALAGDGGAGDSLGQAVGALAGLRPFTSIEERLRAATADVSEAAADLRAAMEAISLDPARLEAAIERRRLLRELCRKYGEQLSDVMAYEVEARVRLAELQGHGQQVAALEAGRDRTTAEVATAGAAVGRARRQAAPRLSAAVEAHLHDLAMARARFEVAVGDDPGDDVTFSLGANPGETALPLAKVASGGELARTCLAARLVLTDAPPTLVFDEVDAGVGGEAALAVGRALAGLAADRQVLVVTHLPQVAAFADRQVAVTKAEQAGRTVTRAAALDGRDRVVELSRMLSGQPSSTTAHGHAEELLTTAWRERGR